jgi:putative DNA primase/helicase
MALDLAAITAAVEKNKIVAQTLEFKASEWREREATTFFTGLRENLARHARSIFPPDDLTDYESWVLWRYDKRDGEETKVPYQINGSPAKTNDRSTWVSFETAHEAYLNSYSKYAGIGFVFSENDPFVGIDIDDCLTDAGTLKPWAVGIVNRFSHTYMEVSPSGTGIKIFARGELERAAKFNYGDGKVETYSTGRFFTVTGNRYTSDTSEVVEDAQEEINWTVSLNSKSTGEKIKPGGRNNTLTSLAGKLHNIGLLTDESLQEANRVICDPPLPAREVSSVARSISKYPRRGEDLDTPVNLIDPAIGTHDAGNARRIKLYSDAQCPLFFSSAEKRWYVWDGARFAKDDSGAAERAAKQVMSETYRQATMANNDDLRKFAHKSLNHSNIVNALRSLQSEEGVSLSVNQLDTHKYLLNFRNGTVDLRTGAIQPHDPANKITKLIHHGYVPGAQCPQFQAMLEKILPPAELRAYLHRALGYSMTGEVSEKVLFICHGVTGNNGKTTLLDLIRRLVIEYSAKIQVDSLMAQRANSDPSNNAQADLADLCGARFANTSEGKSGKRIDEAQVKRITQGNGTIKTARKYENPIEFHETHKLWFDTNQLPRAGNDKAFWSRVRAIPFVVEIPENEIDRGLQDRLIENEATGILTWLVEGAKIWYAEGLGTCEYVNEAVSEWRQDVDTVAPFLLEMCEVDTNNSKWWVDREELWRAYSVWCDHYRQRGREDEQGFYSYLRGTNGLTQKRREVRSGKKAQVIYGIRFKKDCSMTGVDSDRYPEEMIQ